MSKLKTKQMLETMTHNKNEEFKGVDMNDHTIEKLLFEQVEKPSHYLMTKIINVYNNRYRINIYCEREDDGLIKRNICASYFCKYSKNNLEIVTDSDKERPRFPIT